jgi:hypothetical protein
MDECNQGRALNRRRPIFSLFRADGRSPFHYSKMHQIWVISVLPVTHPEQKFWEHSARTGENRRIGNRDCSSLLIFVGEIRR